MCYARANPQTSPDGLPQRAFLSPTSGGWKWKLRWSVPVGQAAALRKPAFVRSGWQAFDVSSLRLGFGDIRLAPLEREARQRGTLRGKELCEFQKDWPEVFEMISVEAASLPGISKEAIKHSVLNALVSILSGCFFCSSPDAEHISGERVWASRRFVVVTPAWLSANAWLLNSK